MTYCQWAGWAAAITEGATLAVLFNTLRHWREANAQWRAALGRESDALVVLGAARGHIALLENAARRVLAADARGQGLPYAEAMRDLSRLTGYGERANE
jgi:hypothetical protein